MITMITIEFGKYYEKFLSNQKNRNQQMTKRSNHM